MPFNVLKRTTNTLARFLTIGADSEVTPQHYPKDATPLGYDIRLFSWLVWTLLGVVSLTGQVEGEAGLAAAVTAVTTAGCAVVVVLGLKASGLRDSVRVLPRIDWICLVGAVLALALLLTLHDPLLAVLLSNMVGFVGFIPTVRKVLVDPTGEGTSVYAFAAVKFALATVAIHEWSVQTWLYPVLCAAEEIAMVLLILMARKKTAGKAEAARRTVAGQRRVIDGDPLEAAIKLNRLSLLTVIEDRDGIAHERRDNG